MTTQQQDSSLSASEQPAPITAQAALAAIETFEIVGESNDSREPNADDRFILTEFIAHAFGGFRVAQPAAAPIELARVKETLEAGHGFWRTCSGCHESEDGHPVGEYPYSDTLQCDLGSGCAECGGIGAVWDSTDYEDLAALLERREEADEAAHAAPSPADERAAFEYDDVVSICDAHGICLPVECVDMVVDIVKMSGLLAARAASANETGAEGATLPQTVLDALRFYANGHHFNIDEDHQQFDTVSGEPQNWLFSERDDDCTMIEDGRIAKAVLQGIAAPFEEPPPPIEGEVFAAAQPVQAEARPTDDELWDQTLRERDECHETADKLAAAVAKHFGVDIGEHSNANCPWEEALEVIENAAQADYRHALTVEQRAAIGTMLDLIGLSPDPRVKKAYQALRELANQRPAPRAELTDAARDVLAERRRQVEQEGWTPAHDDQYRDHELSCAAGCYAMYTLAYPAGDPPPAWPWAADWWKPTAHRRNLVKAGALIQAAIERLDRIGESQ